MTCRCEQCSDDPLPTYTREYAAACLVRHVAGWETHEQRKRFFALHRKNHGDTATDKLRADVWALMLEKKAPAHR